MGALRGIKPATPVHDFFRESLHRAADAPTWIARHYDPAGANEDPSSPLRKNGGYWEPDPQARGIFVVHEPSKDPRVKFIYLSTNPDALGIVSHNWSNADADLKPKVTQTVPGEVELYLPEDPARPRISGLLLLFAVGHGVSL